MCHMSPLCPSRPCPPADLHCSARQPRFTVSPRPTTKAHDPLEFGQWRALRGRRRVAGVCCSRSIRVHSLLPLGSGNHPFLPPRRCQSGNSSALPHLGFSPTPGVSLSPAHSRQWKDFKGTGSHTCKLPSHPIEQTGSPAHQAARETGPVTVVAGRVLS